MTAKELAERLNKRQYRAEMTDAEKALAKENRLVVVFGASDDLMEFRGAIYDEVDCCEGGVAFIDRDKVYRKPRCCEVDADECPLLREKLDGLTCIEAVWCGDTGASWSYKTLAPHETFEIMEDDELYCIGIVFSLDDLEG
jgi:Ribosomal protein L4